MNIPQREMKTKVAHRQRAAFTKAQLAHVRLQDSDGPIRRLMEKQEQQNPTQHMLSAELCPPTHTHAHTHTNTVYIIALIWRKCAFPYMSNEKKLHFVTWRFSLCTSCLAMTWDQDKCSFPGLRPPSFNSSKKDLYRSAHARQQHRIICSS